jgi:hypothetical protein
MYSLRFVVYNKQNIHIVALALIASILLLFYDQRRINASEKSEVEEEVKDDANNPHTSL